MAYQRTHDVMGSTFCGLVMRQYWADLPVWENFLNAHPDIRAIWELGTYHCGMSVYLKLQCAARGIQFWTMDRIRPPEMDHRVAQFMQMEQSFLHGDIWEDGMHHMRALNATAEAHPLLLYADGGDKPREVATFTPLLQPGDYVAVHDYSTEFKLEDEEPVAHLVERVWWEECEAPPRPCLTRFWRRI